jgi:hypothetical protein
MDLYVSLPDGTIITVNTDSSNTLGSFKEYLFTYNNSYLMNQQIITFNGNILTDDTKTLSEYNIYKFNTIYLTMPAPQVSCFLESAPVLTPSGYVKMGTLHEGDLVLTGDGRQVPIQCVKKMRVMPGPLVNPYIVPKGKFGATHRLLISPNHKIHTGSEVTEAKLLGLEQESMSNAFDYYNLELPAWPRDTMVIAGVTVESMAPIRRITVSMEEFTAMIQSRYGPMTPALQQKINASVYFLPDGVSLPAVRMTH